jgi:hypothetical protein
MCRRGGDPAWGHSHRTIEEIYFVLAGDLCSVRVEDIRAESRPHEGFWPA